MHRVNIKHILVEDFSIDESQIVFVEDGIKAYLTVIEALKGKEHFNTGEETAALLSKVKIFDPAELTDDEWILNENTKFDLLILDYHMPSLNGI